MNFGKWIITGGRGSLATGAALVALSAVYGSRNPLWWSLCGIVWTGAVMAQYRRRRV
jgi:hypothetical protein